MQKDHTIKSAKDCANAANRPWFAAQLDNNPTSWYCFKHPLEDAECVRQVKVTEYGEIINIK